MKSEFKNHNFLSSFKNAISGIRHTYKNERNILIQSIFAVIAITCGIFFKISLIEWMILAIVIFIVLICELFNTAIEDLSDAVDENYNEKIKMVKDVAAGAVTLSSLLSVIVGIMMFLPKLITFFNIYGG